MTLPPEYDYFSTELAESTSAGDVSEVISNNTYATIFLERLALTLNVFYTPILIVLGCIGNLISILIFYKSKLRVQSTSQYLSVLAFSDTLFLCQLLPPWLKAVGASTLFSRNGYCQAFVYLSYVCSNLSSWLVVAFTVERFVAVVYPLRRNVMCSVKRARHIIASLTVAALLINLPVLWFAVPSADDCNIDELLMTHAERFNLIDTVVSFTLPLALIVVLNAWIMTGVYRVGRARGNLMRQPQQCRPRPVMLGRVPIRPPGDYQHSQQRVTRMLLIVSTVFVILNLPAYTMRIVAYAYNMGEREYSGKWAALQQICLMFFNTNFGINFALYCMTGQNFRRELVDTFSFLKPRRLIRACLGGDERQARASNASTSFAHSYSNNTEATSHSVANNGANNAPSCSGLGRGWDGQAGARQREGQHINERIIMKRNQLTVPGRRGRGQVIQRWRFDNSRQLRRESIEMQHLPGGNM